MDALATGPITMDTPLGGDLAFSSMDGVEGLSEPFVFEVEAISARSDIKADDLLGASVTLHLALGDEAETVRHWNGRGAGFEYVDTGDDGLSHYRLTLRPWLWQLGLAENCRVYQNMTVPDIAAKVFQDRGFADFERSLFESYTPHEYVVQYRETDLHFVARLLEREGIYYFFRHQDGKHTLVLADSPSAHESVSGYERLPYAGEDAHRDQTMQYVRRWHAQAQLETGAYAVADFDFTKPRAPLYASRDSSDADADSSLEIYEYPAGFTTFSAGEDRARLRLDQARREHRRYAGETNGRGLAVGSTFALVRHPRDDQNGDYLLTSARLRLRGSEARSGASKQDPFACTFRAVRADVGFRAPLSAHKPSVRGPQTATVVGPANQEIWTDQYGRVKVQFHWDRDGANDERSSCWVRVAQAWAGVNWGAQFIPRIGQEVLVDFLEGDPDRPIITGSVYNAANMPPFELPDHQTQSGVRTRSTPNGTLSNGNEIRFEDRKGHEDLFVLAERTQTTVVKAGQTLAVGGDRTVDVEGNEAHAVKKARTTDIKQNDRLAVHGDVAHVLDKSYETTVGDAQSTLVENDYQLKTKSGQIALLHGGSALNIAQSEDIRIATSNAHATLEKGGNIDLANGNAQVSLANGGAIRISASAADVTISRGSTTIVVSSDAVQITASSSVEVTVGGSKIQLAAGGVTVTAPMINLNS